MRLATVASLSSGYPLKKDECRGTSIFDDWSSDRRTNVRIGSVQIGTGGLSFGDNIGQAWAIDRVSALE